MPRKKRKNIRRIHDTRLSFTELCKRAGITPFERIMLIRIRKARIRAKGGEY